MRAGDLALAVVGAVAFITLIGECARWQRWELRGRVLWLLALLCGIAVWDPHAPWALLLAVYAYLWTLYPTLGRDD